mmetsp:Transcript_478/g.1266  ORF Transcript_478/g.1266 Transcript_478/m.1266 type:complete len:130 (-) Transcript_478:48-437(-)
MHKVVLEVKDQADLEKVAAKLVRRWRLEEDDDGGRADHCRHRLSSLDRAARGVSDVPRDEALLKRRRPVGPQTAAPLYLGRGSTATTTTNVGTKKLEFRPASSSALRRLCRQSGGSSSGGAVALRREDI